jgi:hypothetical protein
MITSNEVDIRRTLEFFVQYGEVLEVRGIYKPKDKPHQIAVGYFSNVDSALDAVPKQFNSHGNAYIVMNPISPDLIQRAPDSFRIGGQGTGDADILRRCWLLVDLDPVRPSDVSSTDTEKEAALAKALAVREYLRAEWGVEPALANSGNGYHLLFRIDLPNTEASTALVKGVLEYLDAQFSDEQVGVDTTVYNAARITCLYGTMKRKGSDTPERPHRLSGVVECPENLVPVPTAKLQEMADRLPRQPEPGSEPVDESERINIPAWLEAHGIKVTKRPVVKGDCTIYSGLDCPWWKDDKKPFYVI